MIQFIKPYRNFIIIIGAVIGILTFFTFKEAHFFLQDDNLVQFFPVLYYGLDAFYSSFTIAKFDFSRNLGSSPISNIQYAFFDPILHLAYFLTVFFKSPFLFFNVYVFIYFLIGTSLVYRETRHVLNFKIVLFVVLAALFSGYNIITIRSWYYVTPYIILSVLFSVRLLCELSDNRCNTIRNFRVDALLQGYSFLLGNVQFALFNLLYLLVVYAIALHQKKHNLLRIFKYLTLSAIPSLLVIMVVYFFLFRQNPFPTTRAYYLWGFFNVKDLTSWLSMAFPSNISHMAFDDLDKYKSDSDQNYQYYLNQIVLAAVALFIVIKNGAIRNKPIIFLLSFILFEFILASRYPWQILKSVPIVNAFRIPLKSYYLLNNLLIVFIAYVFTRYKKENLSILGYYPILLVLMNVNPAFYKYSYSIKNLYTDSLRIQKQDVVLYIGPDRDTSEYFIHAATFNLSNIDKFTCLSNYEPFEEKFHVNSWEQAVKLGIQKVIVFRYDPGSSVYFSPIHKSRDSMLLLEIDSFYTLAHRYGKLDVYDIRDHHADVYHFKLLEQDHTCAIYVSNSDSAWARILPLKYSVKYKIYTNNKKLEFSNENGLVKIQGNVKKGDTLQVCY